MSGTNESKRNRILRHIMLCIMLLAYFSLLLTLSIRKTILVILLLIITCIIASSGNRRRISFDRSSVLLGLFAELFAMARFYEYWSYSSLVAKTAERLSLGTGTFLFVVSLICSVFSFYAVIILFSAVRESKPFCCFREWISLYQRIVNVIVVICVMFCELLQLQRSSLDSYSDAIKISASFFVVNLLVLLFFHLLIISVLRREKEVLYALSGLMTVLCIANYYVILYHGSPLFPSEFANAKAAVNVMSGYDLALSPQVADVIGLYALELVLIRCVKHEKWAKSQIAISLVLICIIGFLSYEMLFSSRAMKEKYVFSWRESVLHNGFIFSALTNLKNTLHPFSEPSDYDQTLIEVQVVDNSEISNAFPDIILILNETFCDLDYYSDIEADCNYLESFYSIENANYGYAFSPGIGGGTNDSEFELLTSNSMYLLRTGAPFNYISFDGMPTVLTYLKALGYSSTALHSRTGINYSRSNAYPAIGFDNVILGEDSFSDTERNGNRIMLDKAEYKGLISLYEKDKDSPRFYYLLTYQNHGGWEQNDDSFDTVHTRNDYGDLTDDINEYLSSVSLSAEAFRGLTDYFSGQERPVIICMVGDHAPSFISQMNPNREMTKEEMEVSQRAVPYVIWANFDYDKPLGSKEASMTDLVPMILTCAKMPLTPFYQQVLNVHDVIPVRTRFGLCKDSNGNIIQFDPENPFYETLRQYYFMEYNGLIGGPKYISNLFRIS